MSVQASFHFLKKYGSFLIAIIVLFCAFTTPTRAAVTTRPGSETGLAGYWSLNEGVGTLAHDFSGNLNSGTLTNGPTWTTGKLGKALNFVTSSTTYVDLGTNNSKLQPVGSFTIAGWFKTTSSTQQEIFASYSQNSLPQGIILGVNVDAAHSAKVGILSGNSVSSYKTVNSTTSVNDGKWHYAVGTWDGTNLKIYLDGNLESSSVWTNAPDYNATTWSRIGSIRQTTTDVGIFNGNIDEVRLYNRALSDTEITSLYRTSSTLYKLPPRSGAVALWSFDDNSGTRARDFSWYGNNGTLAGSTGGLPTWVAGKRSRAIRFDGVDDQVNVSQTSSINVSNNATISLWIKPETNNDGDAFQSGLGVAGAMTIWMAGSQGDQIWFGRQQGNVPDWAVSSTTFVPGQWIHVTGVMNAGVETIYINGVAEGSSSNNGSFTNGATYLIGSGDDGHFQGTIDDVKIYNRALSATEVMANYRAGTVVVNGNQNARMTDSLVGLWSFNGADISGTTAYDRSGNSNNGTLTNGPIPTIGKLGQGLNFDGTNDCVDVTSGGLDLDKVTITAWVKPRSFTNYNLIVDSKTINQYSLYLNSAGNASTYMTNGATGPSPLSLNQWQFVSMTYDGAFLTAYKNGVAGSPISMTSHSTGSTGLTIGCRGITQYWFDGSIDEVRVYNRALSASEVKQLYFMGK